MADYAEQFKLRMQRTQTKVQQLQERLDKVLTCCNENDLNAVDNKTAELLTMLAYDVKHEVEEGKRALDWYKRSQ